MSIVRSHVSSSHKPAQGAEASHGKGKSQGAGTAAEGGGGFSSMLLTLGASDELVTEQVSSDLPASTDLAAVPLDPSLLLAQSAQLQSLVPNPDAKAPAVDPRLKPGGLTASDAVAGKDALRADLKEQEPIAPTTDLEKSLAQDAALKSNAKELAQSQHAGHKALLDADNGKQVKNKLEAQAHEQKIKLTEMALTPAASSLPQLSQLGGIGEPGLRQTERLKERLALKQVGENEGGAWGYQALAEAGRIQAPTEAGASAALSPEMMVAEQVSYWIGHDIQNAELKFDGLGEGTVKVNISMQGNEASVAFQSDQPATRQILEGAVAHLKDMLGHEGLLLSSVSVGTSGSGGADTRHARPASSTRPMTAEVAPARMADAVARTPRPTGRALDLFV